MTEFFNIPHHPGCFKMLGVSEFVSSCPADGIIHPWNQKISKFSNGFSNSVAMA